MDPLTSKRGPLIGSHCTIISDVNVVIGDETSMTVDFGLSEKHSVGPILEDYRNELYRILTLGISF